MKGVFYMLVRNCAGGLVFFNNKVFILKNEKGEWVLPKGVIRRGELSNEVAVRRVKEEAGIKADIVSTAGNTNYEFFSVTRQKPVCNKITWYIMKSDSENYKISETEKDKLIDGGFFEINEAMSLITYSQDKSLLNLSFRKFNEISCQMVS